MKKKKYAIIDIETTGGLAKRDKITEIGIVIHDGEKILGNTVDESPHHRTKESPGAT